MRSGSAARTDRTSTALAQRARRARYVVETLELIAQVRTNATIARELVITLGAVEEHISNIFAKLDLPASDGDHRRVLAVLEYLRPTGR